MRKLKLQVQISVDGFVARPHGEMDWVTFEWDEEINQYVQAITDPVGCIVLGRKTVRDPSCWKLQSPSRVGLCWSDTVRTSWRHS